MEIQTITLENWMCRICLKKGIHNIFKDQLMCPSQQQLAPTLTEQHQGQTSTKAHHSSTSISIIDALNYFSEFKIYQPEAVNEPVMLCDDCYSDLINCVQFRKKLNESEFLLRKDYDASDAEDDLKTGLTMQMVDIEPFLEKEESSSESSSQEIVRSSKVHHAKPRFQLTSQVSSILRHVTATRSKSSGINANENLSREKRKESDNQSSSETPKKMQRTNLQPSLENTLIVPYYIFKNGEHDKAHGIREETNESSEAYHNSQSSCKRVDKDDIHHCKHCWHRWTFLVWLARC